MKGKAIKQSCSRENLNCYMCHAPLSRYEREEYAEKVQVTYNPEFYAGHRAVVYMVKKIYLCKECWISYEKKKLEEEFKW